jgi:hypothetical protein
MSDEPPECARQMSHDRTQSGDPVMDPTGVVRNSVINATSSS